MAFRSKATTSNPSLGGGGTFTASMPAGYAAGDRLLAFFASDTTGNTTTPPTGWTVPTGGTKLQFGNDGQSIEIFEFLNSSGADPTTWTTSGPGDLILTIFAFSGRHASTAASFCTGAPGTADDASPTPLSGSSGTAATGDDLCYFACIDQANATQTWTFATYAGGGTWVEKEDTANGAWVSIAGAIIDNVSSGAVGTVSSEATLATGSGNSRGWGQFVIALPAGSTTGPTIDTNPSNAHKSVGDTANFTVSATASGGGALTYQWKLGGVNVSTGTGGTTASYTTAVLGAADDSNSYTCAVTETGGSNDGTNTSTAATLRVGVIFVAASTAVYSSNGGASVSPTYPSGIAADDLTVMLIGQKPSSANGGTATTPASPWQLDTSLTGANDGDTGGYTTTLGVDTGNCNLFAYSRICTGSETGALAVTVGTNNVSWGAMLLFRKPPGATWSVAGLAAKDTSAGNISLTFPSNPGIKEGDIVVAGFCQPTDVTTPAQFSAEAFTATGATFATAVEVEEPDSGTGNDIGGLISYARVTAGPATAAPSFTATAGGTTTNVKGPGVLMRLSTVGSPPPFLISTGAWFQQRNPALYNM